MQNRRKHTRLSDKAEFCDTTPQNGGGGEVIIHSIQQRCMFNQTMSSLLCELGAKKLMPRLVPQNFGAKLGARILSVPRAPALAPGMSNVAGWLGEWYKKSATAALIEMRADGSDQRRVSCPGTKKTFLGESHVSSEQFLLIFSSQVLGPCNLPPGSRSNTTRTSG